MKAATQLSYKNGRFVVRCAYEDRLSLRVDGFRFDAGSREWYAPHPGIAARLGQYADSLAKKKLAETLIQETPWRAAIPYPSEKVPHPFQLEAARFILSRNRSYLAADPGLGKTIIACLALNALNRDFPNWAFAYLCPPFLIPNVAEEFKRWYLGLRLPREIGTKVFAPNIFLRSSMLINRAYHAEIIEWLVENELEGKPSILLVDEAHMYNTPDSKRSVALLGRQATPKKPATEGLAHLFDRVVLMSGTPMTNRPMDLFATTSKLAPETIDFMDMVEYGKRYCAGYLEKKDGAPAPTWNFKGASNLPELKARLQPKYMLRIKKAEVLKELPPLRESIVLLEDDLPKELKEFDANLLAQMSPDGNHLPEGEHVSSHRKAIGLAKVEGVAKFVRGYLENPDENVLLFAYHQQVLWELVGKLNSFNPYVIDGTVLPSKRVGLANDFQKAKHRQLFILNLMAGGVGLNLTKATRVVIAEPSWVPGVNRQAIDRAHRIGQGSFVYGQYLVYPNSMDRAVIESHIRKQRALNQL